MINQERVDKVIQFIECLTVPSGVGAGKPFKMRDWQRDFIRDVYGPCGKNKLRTVRRAVLSIGRKNGKSALIAALVLTHLVGPEAVDNGEIYSAANEREQAALVFKICEQIVRADSELGALLKLVPSTKTIVCYGNGSFYRALSKESGSKHGLNPTVVIYDELAQAPNTDLYDVLDTSMGARDEPLFVTISTQSNDPQHILSQIIDDGIKGNDKTIVTHLYEVPEDADIWDEKNWYLANPALGDFRNLEDVRALARKAKRLPSKEAAFRNLILNQRVDAKSPMIPRAEWEDCKGEADFEPGEDIYVGLDLSGTTDLTAMIAISATEGDRCKAWFWKPGDMIKEHEHRDRVPYALWEQQGIITPTTGRTVHHGFVAQQLGELAQDYHIKGVAYDRWRIDDFRRELDAIGVLVWVDGKDSDNGGLRLVPWGQGFKDMAPALDALEISILERRFKHDGNPCLTWNISNAISVSDPAGNRKLDKSKIRFRIDGAVAAAMAVGLKSRDVSPVEPEYEIFFV